MPLDPRGVRFAAAVTTVVLALVLITGSGWLALAQAVVFALPAVFGMRWSPYGALFRLAVRPRLGPPAETEDAAPVRFSQTVGLVFTVVAAAGYLAGVPALGIVATAFALLAAFLNAAFGFCLGCEVYGLVTRFRAAGRPA
ncbi:DUF4395 domain-containing protein [Actinomycetospora sp. TBRC 11914]|uniref:DUF4395 domain-containing protein n=1 Tax=Actinomycetospora sp. TBRC 11914 TaxID=2729387 RepID=UPI00145DCD44|nr:DUF4395 domain-containing protein [Actinomycetospora sp. TBRC 11914]NMO92222.1 DUF4395 domain-containing protein [Actinomycetospora sp. TBRC 11914]